MMTRISAIQSFNVTGRNELRTCRRWNQTEWEPRASVSIVELLANRPVRRQFIAGEFQILCPDLRQTSTKDLR
jgi:hypothetical protein